MLINLGCIKIRDTANICVMRNTIQFFLAGGLTLPFVEGVAEFDRLQSPDMMTPSSLSWRKVLSLRNGNILGLGY